MKRFLALLAFCAGLTAPLPAGAELVPSADAQTVHDTALHVTWLANANLAATRKFGVAGINAGGSMTYATALAWVKALNAAAYLGHRNWQLPTTPDEDGTCAHTGRHGESFGFGCTAGALGALYYRSLHLHAPNTAVPIPPNSLGAFRNVQPYLYWACAADAVTAPCKSAGPAPNFEWNFSFGNGFQGTNLDANQLYAMVYYPD